jgi:hypothetical protein
MMAVQFQSTTATFMPTSQYNGSYFGGMGTPGPMMSGLDTHISLYSNAPGHMVVPLGLGIPPVIQQGSCPTTPPRQTRQPERGVPRPHLSNLSGGTPLPQHPEWIQTISAEVDEHEERLVELAW